jgi:aromatic-L-amino-acid decarboxylase
MTPEEFRTHGHALVDWIADYVEQVERYPVRPAVAPGWVRSQLPEHPPADPEPFEAVRADLDRVVLPGLTHWQHPSFFGYFPCNSSYPAILGELVSAGLGVNGMLWATSPAATELETLVLDWMQELLGLPERFRSVPGPGAGVIQGTASEATLCAVLAAREKATAGRTNRVGADGHLVAYATSQSHSSVEKALRIAGIGSDNLRLVPVDPAFAMDAGELGRLVRADRAAGRVPFLVVATVGTTSSMAFDPVPAVGRVAREEGLWLHVDAAMAGIAAVCPELRRVNDGLDLADSFCTNPHKWMGVNFDCDLFWVADRRPLLEALSILPEYLRTAAGDAGAVIDYRDWQIPLGRRFRALKLWFTLRADGVGAVQAMVRRHLELTATLASWVAADGRFELAAPVSLNLVCLRLAAGHEATERWIAAVDADRTALFTRTVLGGGPALRVCIGGRTTGERHVAAAWDLLRRCVDTAS